MCTVTYIPKENNHFILTSNRDEVVGRTTLAPEFYTVDGVKMLFPKDAVAGGSWIGVSDKNRLICLLNGGFESHISLDAYRMSRGVVVKELLKSDNLGMAMTDFNYQGIEPFTIIAVDFDAELKATELVWDGRKVHITTLDNTPKIWSSSSLYTSRMKEKRQEWFDVFGQGTDGNANELLAFHTTAGDGDKTTDLLMDRGLLKTVSITQVEWNREQCQMTYHDFQKNEVHQTAFEMCTV